MDRQDKVTLKTLIAKSGLTYRELADRLGTSSSHVTAWNLGRQHMRFDTACKVARELNVSIEELAVSLGYIDEVPDRRDVDIRAIRELVNKLSEQLEGVSEETSAEGRSSTNE